MDDSADKTIRFDNNGICNYCTDALKRKRVEYFPQDGGVKLRNAVDKIKKDGEGHKYDCIMGISGGLDSSYLAYVGYKYGLRTLAIHIDDGFDTKISRSNIKKLIDKTGFDFKIIKPDQEQYNDLILSFMKAGVPNIAIPQDDILMAFMYKMMKKYRIKHFVSGMNFATESILQQGNTHRYTDVVHIKDINRRFGTCETDKLEFLSTLKRSFDRKLFGVHTDELLNFLDYNRNRAFKELGEFCGFEYYGRKHLENIWTAFVQLKWLPDKFGVDKRTSHLSSLIVSDQLSREDALKELEAPIQGEVDMEKYVAYIKKRLGISDEEYMSIMDAPTHDHEDYKIEDKEFIPRLFFAARNVYHKQKLK